MERNFFIGSKWLYYKIYTGTKTADLILVEKLQPVIHELKNRNIIQKWFFIRYNDPDQHIRIRFYCENPENIFIVISKLLPVLNSLLHQNIIWKVQTDTYQRELERYGNKTMEESETLFYNNSEMMLNYLFLKLRFKNNEMEFLFSFILIDSFLNAFSLDNIHKLKLMNNLQTSFKKEFNTDKAFKKEIDNHFRESSKEIHYFICGKAVKDYPEVYNIINENLNQNSKTVLVIKNKLEIELDGFLSSHIHMMLNRQYTSKQRMYELIIYDHLYKYYKTLNYECSIN
jgi:thiopeptide-type bacteriocin biosynthesis protein